jgi:hypothetical protein
MSKDRQRVLDRSEQISLADLFDEMDFQQVHSGLNVLETQVDYGRGEDVKFRVEYGYEYTDVYMDVFRDETDAEYNKRIAKEDAAKEKARKARETKKEKARAILMESEAAERAEYERLRAKFEI